MKERPLARVKDTTEVEGSMAFAVTSTTGTCKTIRQSFAWHKQRARQEIATKKTTKPKQNVYISRACLEEGPKGVDWLVLYLQRGCHPKGISLSLHVSHFWRSLVAKGVRMKVVNVRDVYRILEDGKVVAVKLHLLVHGLPPAVYLNAF
jgi:hypothetical protein